jgi:hypothetical protein
VVGLVIAGVVGIALVLYAVDRGIKARSQARRRRAMRDRLDVATARADRQHEQRQAADQASVALTSVMPAIGRPPLTLPGTRPRPAARPGAGRERAGQQDRRSAPPGAPGPSGRRSRTTGPQPVTARAGQDKRAEPERAPGR